MIFRKATSSNCGTPSPLERILSRIECHSALRLNVLDACDDDGVLVVLCTENSMVKMIKISLQNHWPGEIEVFCPTSLMTGANTTHEPVEIPDQSTEKSLRYLN